jgi:hypothetical protein
VQPTFQVHYYPHRPRLARLIIFQLNGGREGDQQILEPRYFASMYEVPPGVAGRRDMEPHPRVGPAEA